MNFQVSFGEVIFEHPLMNGAGYCKDKVHADELLRSASSAVNFGSVTAEERTGNSGEVYYKAPGGYSLNSLGIPNKGLEKSSKEITEVKKLLAESQKPLIVNIAGFSWQEYTQLAIMAQNSGADVVELNLGCPNIWDGGKQKQIVAFNPDLVEEVVGKVCWVLDPRFPVFVKLSPYSDPYLLERVAKIISGYPAVKAVVTSNTFPNAFAWNERGRPAITPADGLAGMSGGAIKAIALGQVRQFRKILPDRIKIIGVGGVKSGQDLRDYLNAGASAVQIVTSLIDNGPNIFSTILTEYTELLGV